MEPEETNKKRLEIAAVDNSTDDTCRTFVMHNEDHTLGNALRYIIMKNPDVEFCGYSIPHPSENKINFRIQTRGPPAMDVLRKGFNDLLGLCEHIHGTFEDSVQKHKDSHEQNMETDT